MNRLESLEKCGLIKITSAFTLLEELEFDYTKLGDARRTRAARLPQAREGFLVGRSTVGGPDVVGGPDIYVYVDAIADAMYPGVQFETLTLNTQRDVLHLAAHRAYQWELFVTEDNGILQCAAQLRTLDICVMSPADAVSHLDGIGIN
jgi:hypothetical protein